jgi:multisubunit Na+/H+ antiporter MnhE subunit
MVRGALATAVNMLVWWGLLFLLYVISISTVPPLEVLAGSGFALLGAIAAEAVRRAEHPGLRGSRRIGAAAAGFPLTLLQETAQLTAAVGQSLRGRGPHGSVVTIRLAPETDAALAAALLSASPGACVIDIDDAAQDKAAQTPSIGHDLTAHVLGPSISRVERALGGRRLG